MLQHITLARPLAIFDLETTGPDSFRDRIVEISILRLMPDGTETHQTRRCNPQMPISPGATAIHGIRDEDVANEPPFSKLARSVREFLEGCDLCGYNIRKFDVRMLINEFKRCNVPFNPLGRRILDPMAIFHAREPRNLVAAVKRYCDREHVEAHGARADVLATLDVLNAQLALYEDLPRSIDALHELFVDPAAVDFEGKFKRDGDGKVCFAFGQYNGRRVEEVIQDPRGVGFLRWMLDRDFLDDAKAVAREFLEMADAGTY